MTGQQKDGGRKAFLGFIKNKKQEKWLLLLLVGILLLVISFPTKQKTADESGGIISETETDYEVYERRLERRVEQLLGSMEGIEKKLIEAQGIPYYGIASGKLRRYFDVKNFTDPFRVLKGFGQASRLMKTLKPDVVFSKGGFVSVPVVMAARRRHIPVICHESDLTPGLANKLSMPSATKVCCNFPETVPYLPAGKAVLTGCPIRQELKEGSRAAALAMTGFT